MVYPLIRHPQRMWLMHHRQAVLRQHRQTIGGDHFRDAMIDLRVNMIRTASQHDALAVVLLHPVQRHCPLQAYIFLGTLLLGPCRRYRLARLVRGNSQMLFEERAQIVHRRPLAAQGEEGLEQPDIAPGNIIHIVSDVFRIGNDHRAVVIVLGSVIFLMLIIYAGVENRLDALVDQPLNVPVRQLGRIALALRRDGLHTQLVYGARAERRQDNGKSQLPEHGGPEREVLIYIQNTGDANDAARSFLGRQRFIIKDALELICHQVRALLDAGFLAQAPFAAVACNVAPVARKDADGQHTTVGTARAAGCPAGIGQTAHLLQRQHGRGLVIIAFPRQQRSAEGPHDPRDIRTHDLTPCQLFKRAQDCLVVECTALHDNVRSKIIGIGQLDHLVQRIFDHRISQTGGYVLHRRPLLLRLLDIAVHEHRTAGSQIQRLRRKERFCGKSLVGVAQRLCKV